MKAGKGGGVAAASLFLCLALGLLPAAAGAAEDGEADRVLPGCGICYPSGFDANTVGAVRGPVSAIAVPEDGPVSFVVTDEGERWTVLAAPAWFWKLANPAFAPGDVVAVRGSKSLGADGNLYIVAQEIRHAADAPPLLLRDGRGGPLWRGGHGGGSRGGGNGGGMRSGHGRNGGGPGRR